MSRHPCFRFFLMLALLLNGLATAHAAVGHVLMQMPALHAGMNEGEAMTMEDCHDMAEPAPVDKSAPERSTHKGMACGQGSVCNCACAMQMPVSFSAPASRLQGRSVQAALRGAAYLSIDLPRILRPPIA